MCSPLAVLDCVAGDVEDCGGSSSGAVVEELVAYDSD